MVSKPTKLHPLEAIDWDMLEFWLKLIPDYKRNPAYHDQVHRELIRPRYDVNGNPLPILVCLAGGERSGKSKVGAGHMFAMHWNSKVLWIVGERYDDCRLELQYILEAAKATGTLKDANLPSSGPSRIVFNNGCVISTKSSDDYTTLASESPDGVLMVEAGRQSYQAFRTLWIRVAHHTSWLLVSGTFETYKGRWFPNLWTSLQGDNEYKAKSMSFPTYANPVDYPDGAEDPKLLAIKATLSEEEFAERFLGLPRPPIGVVFPEFRRYSHVTPQATYDPMYPIRLWVDPGYYPSSYAVLFVQIVGDQARIIKEYYTNSDGTSPGSIKASLVNEDMVNIVLSDPLVSKIDRLVIDIASQAHAGAQEPAMEAWRKGLAGSGIVIPIFAKYVKLEDGLKRTHDKLRTNPITRQPWLIINHQCENTIWELEDGYRFHTRKEGTIAGDKPIDEHNHSAKAIAYGLIDAFGYSDNKQELPPAPTRKRINYGRGY